ncbi:endolytic transglycosylase MltG [Desulfovibrio inopinatus]|uniref:endolytic transglycosylase MltG n=1 Tax=Desulfovibrio inopinatus TaxID=102109 RepID=UPI00040C6760|nr:endolytic transglycosylase MltG [Desulfovibrio inopinatus]
MKSLFLGLFGLLLLAILGLGWYGYSFLSIPPATPGESKRITIVPGESFIAIAKQLEAEGVVKDAFSFRILARVMEKSDKIRAGEFEVNTGWKPLRVLNHLVSSQGLLHRLSVPEGLTLEQTAAIVEKSGMGSAASFLSASRNPTILGKYNIPAKTAEGFLFPETYFFTKQEGNDATYVVEAMLKEFNKQLAEVFPEDAPTGNVLFEFVTLASIVEKESAVPVERPRIAGVFINRLRRGMLLQTDPTIIYGLGPEFDGNLTRKHLDDPSNPYNTYQHPGLPPGPICSPGKEALLAVKNAEHHNYLYFVAKGSTGEHYFSKSLREHINAVNKYQLKK